VKPDGEYFVPPGEEESLLAPLPISLVPGIERDDLLRLREFNLTQVSDVTQLSLAQLEVPFGTQAHFLYEAVRGIDRSPVLPIGQKPPQVIVGHEFGNDTNNASTLDSVLYTLVEHAGHKLRERRQAARRIAIVLDYSDGMRHARQVAARPATANDLTLFTLAKRALSLAWFRRVRVRHIRLICDRLTFPPAQRELFPAERKENKKRDNLIVAIDRIRQRFGNHSVRMGRTLAASV
jgi:DNA polymerase-4